MSYSPCSIFKILPNLVGLEVNPANLQPSQPVNVDWNTPHSHSWSSLPDNTPYGTTPSGMPDMLGLWG